MVKGASVGLGVRALMKDLGWEYKESMELRTDASAAIGIADRVVDLPHLGLSTRGRAYSRNSLSSASPS